MRLFIGVLCLLQLATFGVSQFVTFKDGKIGVNFGGYNAEAGLGGLLTGNAAHGGLSASAGTPWGPRAAAGLGGDLNGRPSGIAYAGAQASPSVGASTVLGGSVGQQGFAGSEAHADGKVVSTMHSTNNIAKTGHDTSVNSAPLGVHTNYVQKIKPPKKYSLINPELDLSAAGANIEIIENSDAAANTSAHGHNAGIGNENGSDRKYFTTSGTSESDAPSNDATVVIVNRERRPRTKRVKRPRQRVRLTTIIQQHQQPAEQPQPEHLQQHHQDQVQFEQQQLLQEQIGTDDKVVHTKKFVKTVHRPSYVVKPTSGPTGSDSGNPVHSNPGVVFSALNIPIGILRSLQESLSGLPNAHANVHAHNN